MTLKELRHYIACELNAYRQDEDIYLLGDDRCYDNWDHRQILRVDGHDFDVMSIPENCKGSRYCIFVDQVYNTYPIPSHFEPIPNEFNDVVEYHTGLYTY